MKKFIFILALFISAAGFSQSINDYQYLVLPNKFDFQKSENQFNLNNLVKMMLEKYGFTVYYENVQKPDELALDRCKAIYADVQKVPGFLSTNVSIALKDCNGRILFQSQTGKSKEKEYKNAYHEAIRNASRSFEGLNYRYNGGSAANVKHAQAEPLTSDVAVVSSGKFTGTLNAQPIPNGYQLVDNTPKVVLRIYKTSKADSFTAISDKNNGLVFKKDNEWYFEYYHNDKLMSEKLDIKF